MDTSASGIIVVTSVEIEGRPVREYLGIVSGEATLRLPPGVDRTLHDTRLARQHSGDFERRITRTRSQAIAAMVASAEDLGATGILAVDIDYTTVQHEDGEDVLVITALGTAVLI